MALSPARLAANRRSLAAAIGAGIISGSGGALQATARKILAAVAAAQPITVASTPATMTTGALNAASTISGASVNLGASNTAWNNARMSDVGGVWALDPNNTGVGFVAVQCSNRRISGTLTRRSTPGAGKRFRFDGQVFDMCLYGAGFVRVAATDVATGQRQWYCADTALDASGWRFIKCDFGSRKDRIVEVYLGCQATLGDGYARGFNFVAGDTVQLVNLPNEPRVVALGDSFIVGVYQDSIKARAVDILAERLGANVMPNGIGGTGYLAQNNLATWRERIANGDLATSLVGNLDLVFAWGSVNDYPTFSDAAVTAEVTATVQGIMAAQPGAIIMIAGPQNPGGKNIPASRFAAVQAGVVAAAAGDRRVVYIDNSPVGEAWQAGTGNTGSPKGDGNNDTITGPDGVHPSADGNRILGNKAADSIIAKLQALAA